MAKAEVCQGAGEVSGRAMAGGMDVRASTAKIVAIMPKSLRTRCESREHTARGEGECEAEKDEAGGQAEGNARIINKICTLSLPVQQAGRQRRRRRRRQAARESAPSSRETPTAAPETRTKGKL